MERNVSMVLFLNSEWEEFIFSLGNFPHRICDAGWETGASQLCSHMGVTLCRSRRLVQPFTCPLSKREAAACTAAQGLGCQHCRDAQPHGYDAISPAGHWI